MATTQTDASVIRDTIASKLEGIAKAVDWDRSNFTQTAVSDCIAEWGEFSWVTCHTAHSYIWTGQQGIDYDHWHYELDVYGAGTIGYEFYWTRKGGVFSRNGDGGYINWAWNGSGQKVDTDGKVIMFTARA